MKKISMIVVFCMVLGLLFSSVAAQDAVSLVVSSEEGELGEKVVVKVGVDNDVALAGFQLLINYDPDFLEFSKASSEMRDDENERVGNFMPNAEYGDKVIAIAWANSEDVAKVKGDTLFSIEFTIKADSKLEDAVVAIDLDDEYNQVTNADNVKFALGAGVAAGTVSLAAEEPDPVTPTPVTPDPVTPTPTTPTDVAKTKKGSQMMPFMLLGGLLTLIGAAMILPSRKLRRQ